MTPQTLFTSWPRYSSWEYSGQSRTVAYFSMEIAITPAMPTYSGGLGVLAGDTLRAAADMGLALVAVTLAHRKGYFKQHLDPNGVQSEEDQPGISKVS
jgi:glycogen phosphorylase